MKKIILTFILALSAFFVEAQFGNTFIAPGTNVGTRQTNDGGYWPKLLFQPPTFGDTTAANNGKTNFYAGSVIFTTADGNFWYRTANATRWVLFTPQFNVCAGLISGGIVTLNTGLIMNVTAATYCINNTTYNSPATTLTLATADPTNARYDVFIADTSSTIKVITGTPSADPVIPQINPATQVFLAYVRVNAGATTPSGVSREVIYNENVEWAATSSLLGGSVNFANTNFPYIGTIAADIALGTSGTLQFTKSDTININDYNVFQMFVRLKAAFSAFTNIQVAFTLGGSPVSNYITLDNTTGFIKTTVGSYQNISIGVPAFTFSSTQIDGLQLRLTGTNGGFYLDYVQLQNGIIPPNQDYDNRYVKLYVPDTTLAVKTLADSLVLNNSAFASAVTSVGPPSVPVSWRVNTRDTLAGVSIVGEMDAYIQGRRGSSTPNFDWFLQSKNSGIKGLTVNTDGTVTMGNGLIFNAIGRITGPTTITYFGNSTTLKNDFVNFGQPLAAGGVFIRGRTGTTSGALAKILNYDGDGNLPVLYAFTEGVVASGTANPSLKAQMDIVSVGKGVIFPRMTTAQRDGIPKRVATVTITNGGAGMIAAPTITATTTGLPARFTGTISGGVLTAITIDYGGTNYTAGGSLIIDTTGTNATVLPVATYTQITDTIPYGLIVNNRDSLCYQSYNGSAWINMREGSGGGGGSVGTLQQVTTLDSTTTHEIIVQGARLAANQLSTYLGIDAGSGDNSTYSVGIGYGSLSFASGTQNIGIGVNAAQSVIGNGIVGIGRDAGINNVGNRNIFIGDNAGDNSAGSSLVGIGVDALSNNGAISTAEHVTAIGDSAGHFNQFSDVSILGAFANADSTNQVVLSDGVHQVRLDHALLTGDIKAKWQNRSGIIAYTDDISPDTLVIQNYPLQSAVVGATIEQSINQDFLDSVRPKYRVYTARISQTGTSAPTEDYVYENTLGSASWSYNGTGEYTLTITGAFTVNKTTTIQSVLIPIDVANAPAYLTGDRIDDDTFSVKTGDRTAPIDDAIKSYTIEIRVYY